MSLNTGEVWEIGEFPLISNLATSPENVSRTMQNTHISTMKDWHKIIRDQSNSIMNFTLSYIKTSLEPIYAKASSSM